MALPAERGAAHDGSMARTALAPRPSERPADGPKPGVTVRPIDAADAKALHAFYGRLGPDSSRLRFFGRSVLTENQARGFAAVDGQRRQGFVAILNERGPRDGSIVGHLCLEPTDDEALEVAVAVEDDFQRHGIGRSLLDAAIHWARGAGVKRLQASMFVGNAAIRRLLAGAGLPYELRPVNCGLMGMELSLDPA
jgi:acetyltransferase